MFDLIAGNVERPLREGTPRSTVVSVALHVGIAAALIGVPLLSVTNTLPEVPTIMAFVSAPPPSPPPPPPPAPPPAPAPAPAEDTRAVARNEVRPAVVSAAPVQAPSDIASEPATARPAGDKGGTEGGVEGGIPGGVVQGIAGGIVGGAPSVEAPPPAPPPAPTAPVRAGGLIRTPELLHRVEPIYPDVAAAAQITGIVILEAVVDTSGCVESIRVLRGHPLLSRAATNALTEWRYKPLTLNGIPTSFVLTVTFNFSAGR